MREIMNRKKAPEIEKEKEAEKMERSGRERGGGCCGEAATGLLRGAWRRLIIQLIMIRLFPAGTAALEMESLCSHTPQWKRWGMVPCRWDVCTYAYTHIQTHTHANTSKRAALLTSHEQAGLTPTHTFLYTERRTQTNTFHTVFPTQIHPDLTAHTFTQVQTHAGNPTQTWSDSAFYQECIRTFTQTLSILFPAAEPSYRST